MDDLIKFAREEIKVWARWFPLTLNQIESEYYKCYKQLIKLKIIPFN